MSPDFRRSDFVRLRWPQLLLLLLAGIAGTAFAATAPQPYRTGEPHLRGKLTIVGARAMAGVVERWAVIFRREHPGVEATVAPVGSGAAAGALADGVADIAAMTRAMGRDERGLIASAHRDLQGVVVGFVPATVSYDRRPLVIYLNRGVGIPPNSIATEFVRIALSAEGQRQFATGGLNGAERARALSALRDLATAQ